ncbi:MAG: signal peptidase II [Rickettsiales bacterium]
MKAWTRIGLVMALVTIVLDQLSKWFFLEVMRLPDASIDVLPIFKLVMVWNQGVSFGMFADEGDGRRWMLIIFSLVIVTVLFQWLRRATNWQAAYGLGLVIGGALGNVIDRLRFGAVADFFYFHYEKWYWPAFNIADAAIFIGVVLLCWEGMVSSGDKKEM